MEKLFLVDAYALIFKFYYAFINRPMRNSEGLNTSAIYGVTKFINSIITHECPQYLGVAFDPKGGNFRHQLYPEYKANRGDTPEDIILSTPHIKRILEAMKIPVLEVPNYEADDVIGTISSKAACNGFEVYMVTPDKDYGQLIRDCCYMYKPGKNGEKVEIIGKEKLKEIYGIDDPLQIIDILALWGDASDNVPGVPGIGEKTAVKLVNEFGCVENIIANASQLKGKLRDNILEYQDRLLLAKRLVTIDQNVPIAYEPDKLIMENPDYDELKKIYIEMGFSSLLRDLDFWEKEDKKRTFLSQTPLLQENEVITVSPNDTPDKPDEPDLFSPHPTSTPKPAATVIAQTKELEPSGQLSLFDERTDTGNIATIPHQYTILMDRQGIEQLASVLMLGKLFCFDTETTGLNPLNASLVGLSICTEAHKAYYIPLPHADKGKCLEILEILRPVFEAEHIAKIGQNTKFDILMLKNYSIEVKGFLYDTMIMHYLLNSDERHGMDYLAEKYLNYTPVPIEALIGKGAKQLTMDTVDLERIAEYAAEDADVTFQLYRILWKELEQNGLCDLYKTIEEPLIRVLADMEHTGIVIDTAALKSYEKELNEKLILLENQIRQLAGKEININSSKQIGEILFEHLKIEAKPKLTKTKQYRTDEEYLISLRNKHEIIDIILEYRGVKKLLSTYVEALPKLINPKTGRIHTTYNQTVASTGRLSSNNPNLQNIPIRDEQGKRIREAFIACDNDHILLSADYSQIELRIMADLSGDPALMEAFIHGEDVHASTAAKIFNKPLDKVTADQRRQAKTANFGIIYGISAFGLAQRLDISRTEAKNLIDGYFNSYPQVKAYMERIVKQARENGYVETIFHRKKALPDIHSSNAVVRSYAERNAINAPIQGSAADIIKIAMSTLFKKLNENGCKAKLILQVHDELVLELPKEELETVTRLVLDSMENAVKLQIPLVADYGYGKNWLKAH